MTRRQPQRSAPSVAESDDAAEPFSGQHKHQELEVSAEAVRRIFELRRQNILDLEYMETSILKEYWQKAIAEMSNAEIKLFDQKVRSLLIVGEGSRPAIKPLPPCAPELFVNRPATSDGERETIIAFLLRVYGPWMDGWSMVRADLRRLDVAAVKALENFEFKNGSARDLGIDIPTLSERNTRLLERGIENEPDALRRKGMRALQGQRRHGSKKKHTPN